MSTATKPKRVKLRKGSIMLGLGVFLGTVIGGSGIAYAADDEPTTPQDFGQQFGNNDFSDGGAKTLYENYSSGDYVMPTDTSFGDVLASSVNGAANLMLYITKALVSAVITLVSWLFDMNDTGEVTNNLSSMIGGTTTVFMTWLLPTALAAGALVAYIHSKRDGNGGAISQLTWVAVAALFTVSLAMTPAFWTTTTDTVRTLAVDGVNGATADALTVNEDFPFSFDGPDYSGEDSTTTMKRKTSDALWRNFVAMPWCMSTLGSIEACERYGQDILEKHGDKDAIVKYVKNEMADREGGQEAATVKYAKGHYYWERLGQAAMVSGVALVMAAAIMVLGFGAFACMVLSWLLLAVGGFFAMLWVLPGVTREWGKQWFYALIGAIAGAAVKMLIFQAVVLVVISTLTTSWALGIRTITAIVVVIAGLGLNRTLDGIVGSSGAGMLRTMATGYMAGRAMKSVAKGTGRAALGAGRGALGAGRLAARGGRGAANGIAAWRNGRNKPGETPPAPMQDMGERTPKFRALDAPPKPALMALGAGAKAPGARSLPTGGKGTRRSGVAFQGERGSGAWEMSGGEHQAPGHRAMRVNPAKPHQATSMRHGSTNSARPSGLPEGPRNNRGRSKAKAGARPQFRNIPQPTVIQGELVDAGSPSSSAARPRRSTGNAPRARQTAPPTVSAASASSVSEGRSPARRGAAKQPKASSPRRAAGESTTLRQAQEPSPSRSNRRGSGETPTPRARRTPEPPRRTSRPKGE